MYVGVCSVFLNIIIFFIEEKSMVHVNSSQMMRSLWICKDG